MTRRRPLSGTHDSGVLREHCAPLHEWRVSSARLGQPIRGNLRSVVWMVRATGIFWSRSACTRAGQAAGKPTDKTIEKTADMEPLPRIEPAWPTVRTKHRHNQGRKKADEQENQSRTWSGIAGVEHVTPACQHGHDGLLDRSTSATTGRHQSLRQVGPASGVQGKHQLHDPSAAQPRAERLPMRPRRQTTRQPLLRRDSPCLFLPVCSEIFPSVFSIPCEPTPHARCLA